MNNPQNLDQQGFIQQQKRIPPPRILSPTPGIQQQQQNIEDKEFLVYLNEPIYQQQMLNDTSKFLYIIFSLLNNNPFESYFLQ